MKLLFIVMFVLQNLSTRWLTDFEQARQKAYSEQKLIVLNFSGSDWCGPCIQMHKEIFDSEAFEQFANVHLVLVKADFPRLKKNALTKDQQKKNDQLAEIYNKKGIFPATVLLTAEGNPIKIWEGFPQLSAGQFIREIQFAMVTSEKHFYDGVLPSKAD